MGEPIIVCDAARDVADDERVELRSYGVGKGARGVLLVEVAGSVLEVHLSSKGLASLAGAAQQTRDVVDDLELTDPDPAYYVAARDGEGHIRLRSGAGQLVARADDTLATVRGWLTNARPGSRFAKAYQAAIDLLVTEAAAGTPAPNVPFVERPETTCPGCGEHRRDGDLCCDGCWSRIPTDLPDLPRWRTSLRSARQINNWTRIEKILTAAGAWLSAHPRRSRR